MRILSRYLLKEHLGPFAFAGLALTGLLVLNQVALRLANLIGKGLGWNVIGSVFGLSLPFILAMTLPMAVLVAVLHAFTRLGADSEVTALKASGVNLMRVVRPVLVAATLIGLFEFLFVDQVLPRSNHRLKNLLIDIARKKPTFELVEQSVNEVVPGKLFLRAGRIDQATDRMREVVIYDLANATRRRTIYADSGYIRFNAAQTDLFLTLFDGYIHDYDRDQAEQFRRIFFGTDVIRVVGVSNQLERTGENDFRGDREMGLCEMEDRVRRDFTSAANADAEADRARERDALALVGVVPPRGDTSSAINPRHTLSTLYCGALGVVASLARPDSARADTIRARRGTVLPQTTPAQTQAAAQTAAPQGADHVVGDPTGQQLRSQLTSLESQRKAALTDAAAYQVEIHKKYSLAVACIVFVLIGAPVALRFPRGGIGLVIGASVVIFGVYYIGLIGGEALGDGRLIPPFWAMWAPNFIMGTIGLLLFARLGREQATARGGTPLLTRWAQRLRRRRRTA